MAALLTPETFEFFALYLLSGYVVIFVRSAFVLGLRPKPAELLIEAVVLSLLVQMAMVGAKAITDLIVGYAGVETLPAWVLEPAKELKLAVQVLVVPTALGSVLGLFLRSDWRNGVLRRLSLPVVHPVRRAHDYAFGNDRPPGFVEITYADGTKIAGWFGQESLASTDDRRSDLYLEKAYLIDENGDWKDPDIPRSILVSLTDVRSVEFLSNEVTTHE